MSDIKTVGAWIDVKLFVTCPNKECGFLIDLLDEKDTDNTVHNDDGYLLQQIFGSNKSYMDFECEDVVCTECKTTFNVKELKW